MKFEAQLKEQQTVIHTLQRQMDEQNKGHQATIGQLQDQMKKMQIENQSHAQSMDLQANSQRMTVEELLQQIQSQSQTIKYQEASIQQLQGFNDNLIVMYRYILGLSI
eukprot:CAMPEP_0202700918 /NCGR_PEP_ID=MMETSP1385-20130828/14045_1 /ASSEMBLY_ACC=CAM_ASM_000861 /TAXON_ID=933848 /ORGANISM="Elphidium margaritaceum" /LENGTH=107 /DNA_ID=CAMNT_0049358209 /DNA_START=696 /DNA_END=1019 /DNA_ORIENTATION=+